MESEVHTGIINQQVLSNQEPHLSWNVGEQHEPDRKKVVETIDSHQWIPCLPFIYFIKKIPNELSDRYKLLKLIPVEIERIESGVYVAFFKEANISMTGYSRENARDELAHTIIDFLDTFRDDPDFIADVKAVRFYINERNIT